MILDENAFVERDAEMEAFCERDARLPTLVRPCEQPVDGVLADLAAIVTRYGKRLSHFRGTETVYQCRAGIAHHRSGPARPPDVAQSSHHQGNPFRPGTCSACDRGGAWRLRPRAEPT